MSSFKKLSPDELEQFVLNYQKGDSHAAELLRQYFSPLIYRLTHRHSVYATLGEDAENIAWILFYEFISKYQGADFIHLPGLVRRFMIFRMMNHISRISNRFNLEMLDQFDGEGTLSQIAGPDELEACLDGAMVAYLFADLPRKQRAVLKYALFHRYTQQQIAAKLNCSTRYVRKCKTLALKHIKKKLHSC